MYSFNSLFGILHISQNGKGASLSDFQLPFRDSLKSEGEEHFEIKTFNSLFGIRKSLLYSIEEAKKDFQLPFRDSVEWSSHTH